MLFFRYSCCRTDPTFEEHDQSHICHRVRRVRGVVLAVGDVNVRGSSCRVVLSAFAMIRQLLERVGPQHHPPGNFGVGYLESIVHCQVAMLASIGVFFL